MRHSRSRKRVRGSAAVEFALVLPILVTTLLGVWDFGRLLGASQVFNNAVREAGRQASTGAVSTAAIQQSMLNALARGGIPTNNVTFSLVDITDTSQTDPTVAAQLDRFQLTATLPSKNVRLILLKNLLGSNTLSCSVTWTSMNDIPISVNPIIPIN